VILPEDVYEQVVNLSNANDVSVAWVMRQAVVQFLAAVKNENGLKINKKK
jgi:predicted transcriptional regulator